MAACFRDDLRFHFMELGIEDVVGYAGLFEHLGDFLGDLDGDRTDQDRLALLVGLLYRVHDGAEFFLLCLVDGILVVETDHGTVGRDLDDVHTVDLAELALLGEGGTGHAAFFIKFIEKVLEGDRRKCAALALDFDVFLCLDRLVKTVGVTAAGHHAACELIDDQDLVVLDYVIVVAVHQIVGTQGQDDAVLDLQVLGIRQVLDTEKSLDLGYAFRGEVDELVLFVDDKIAGLFALNAHDGIDLGQIFDVGATLHLACQNVACLVDLGGFAALTGDDQRCPGFVDSSMMA